MSIEQNNGVDQWMDMKIMALKIEKEKINVYAIYM